MSTGRVVVIRSGAPPPDVIVGAQLCGSVAEVIDKYKGDEIASGRIFGPSPKGRLPNLQINRMGAVTKGHTPGRWRLVTALSFPKGTSVNDGIDLQLCSQWTTWPVRPRALEKGHFLLNLISSQPTVSFPFIQKTAVPWDSSAHFINGMLPFSRCIGTDYPLAGALERIIH